MLIRLSFTIVCVLLGFTHTHGAESSAELITPEPVTLPHFTKCRSRDLETFRCWWSSGSLSNFSAPGSLTVYFQKSKIHPGKWEECPDYTPSVHECFFNKTVAHIWTPYCLQLRSTNNVTYDETCFTVEDIVYPDPPVGLNWTLLNISSSGLNFDVMVSWAPPLSASMGWMNLKYEVQYRVQNSSHWDKLPLVGGDQQSLYGLNPHKQYELRIHSKMSAFQNFGDFSDSIFIQILPALSTTDSAVSMRLVLIVCVTGLLILFILILLSQQQRLMVILLPPVPAPKIKGIDPELLKSGKLDQLNSLLSTQHVYRPDSYPDDSWLEFIHIDLDDAAEKHDDSDTQRLLNSAHHASIRHLSSSLKADDDSGLELEPEREERHPLVSRTVSGPNPKPQSEVSWTNMDFYAQVSDVTPGGVVLSPEQPTKKKEELKEKAELQLRVAPESNQNQNLDQSYHVLPPEPLEPRPGIPPLSDYTVVQEVDGQRSFLLNPPLAPPGCPQHHPKCPPNAPLRYLTPELLEYP